MSKLAWIAPIAVVVTACAPSITAPSEQRAFYFKTTPVNAVAAIIEAGSGIRPTFVYTPFTPVSQTTASVTLRSTSGAQYVVTQLWTLSEPAPGITRVTVNSSANRLLSIDYASMENAILAELDKRFGSTAAP